MSRRSGRRFWIARDAHSGTWRVTYRDRQGAERCLGNYVQWRDAMQIVTQIVRGESYAR